MKRNSRTPIIAIIFLVIGVTGQFTVSDAAQRKNMGMMGMGNCMMRDRMPKGINPSQLPEPGSDGARLLSKYCSQCHDIPGPGLHTAEEWSIVISRMNQRMQIMSNRGMMRHIDAPNEMEYKTLVAYIKTNSQQTIDVDMLQGAETLEGQDFQKTCTQCHALPNPSQHTSSEWPDVVDRMRKNMESMGVQAPDQAVTDSVLKFLQTYSTQ